MKKTFIFALALSSVMGFAQEDYNGRVGINTDEPKASLDITRHTTIPAENPQGLILPKLTTDQRNQFVLDTNNQQGLMIYNLTKNCIDYWDSEKWSCTDGSNTDYSPVNATKNKSVKADVWDRTHYIGSFNHSGANIDGVINNTTNRLTLKIPYNQATVGGAYNEINVKRTIKDRNGNNILLTLHIPKGTFTQAKGFLEGIIKVGNFTTADTFSVKQLDANTEEVLTTFTFRINGHISNVNLVASGGLLDKMFDIETNGKLEHQFIYLPVSVYVDTLNKLPDSGQPYEKKWLNNNLGANYAKVGDNKHTQQATDYIDSNAYGSLFQWQRPADGHELVNWDIYIATIFFPARMGLTGITATLWDNTNWKPDHNQFIKNNSGNWVSSTIDSNTSNHNLWQSGGVNNPCPTGFHIPTLSEWNNLHTAMGSNAKTYWATNPLRLTAVGNRVPNNGEISNHTDNGYYWSSSTNGNSINSVAFSFTNSGSGVYGFFRANGQSVRCIAD